jgi:hypothetical protein
MRYKISFVICSLILSTFVFNHCSLPSKENKIKAENRKKSIRLLKDQIKIAETSVNLQHGRLLKEIKNLDKVKDAELIMLLKDLNKSSKMMNKESINTAISPINIQDTGEIVQFNLSNTDNRPAVLVNP